MKNRFNKGDKLKMKLNLTGGTESVIITYSHYAGCDCFGNHYFYDADGNVESYHAWYKAS